MSRTFTSTTTCDKCGLTTDDDEGWFSLGTRDYMLDWDLCPNCFPVLKSWIEA
jgi:hypothetical protein